METMTVMPHNTVAIMAAALSCERIFYSIVCHAPRWITRFSTQFGDWKGKEPEFIFRFVYVFKVVQAIVFAGWYYYHFGAHLISAPSVLVCILSAVLVIVGQILNAAVWQRIGVQGVCYGIKFGRKVAWCTQFPFNVMDNPQYSGAIMTVWGMFMLTSEATPSNWMVIPIIETILYVFSMKAEY